MRIILIAPLMLAFVSMSEGACPVRCRVVQQQQVQVVAAQAILVPSYGGSYGQQAPQSNDDLIKRLVEVLERLEARLDGQAGGLTAEAIISQDCRRCHTEGDSPKKGFILWGKDGKPVQPSLGDMKVLELRVRSKDPSIRMPPEKGLSDARAAALIQALRQ